MSERRSTHSLRRQAGLLTPLLVVWTIAAYAIAIAGFQTRVPRSVLFLDQGAVADVPWYAGMLSNVGYIVWTVAATAALGGGWVATQTRRPSAGRFLFAGSSATVVLLLDDMFRLHSDLLPNVLGVPKPLAMLIVVTPALAWLAIFNTEVARTRWLVLGSSLGMLFGSIIADQVLAAGDTSLLVEDGAKFLGVLAWMLYFVLTSNDIAKSTIRDAMRPDAAPHTSEAVTV